MKHSFDKNLLNDSITFYKQDWQRRYKIRRILISRLRFMGDVVLTTSILPILAKHFPKAKIDYLAEPPYIDLLQNHPLISNLFSFDKKLYFESTLFKSLAFQFQLVKQLRNQNYDLAIDLLGIPRSAFLLKLTKAPIRIGGCFRYRSHLYTHCFDPSKNWRTAYDFHNLALQRIGINENPESPKIYLTAEEIDWAKKYLNQKGIDLAKPIIGIHPGATWPAKIWPFDRFCQLANKIIDNLDSSVFMIFGPEDQHLIENVKKNVNPKVVIGDLLNLRQLAAVLSQFSVYISNDCGPMHIAPAVGTPTIGIFGPSEPEIWFPYKKEDGHRLMIKEVDCRPCHQNECPIQHQCMDWISVDEVFQTLIDFLQNHAQEI